MDGVGAGDHRDDAGGCPPGQPSLGDTAVRQLQRLTESLITAKGGASEEYERFRAISQRALCLPQALLTEWLQGAVVLVTGGTAASARRSWLSWPPCGRAAWSA